MTIFGKIVEKSRPDFINAGHRHSISSENTGELPVKVIIAVPFTLARLACLECREDRKRKAPDRGWSGAFTNAETQVAALRDLNLKGSIPRVGLAPGWEAMRLIGD